MQQPVEATIQEKVISILSGAMNLISMSQLTMTGQQVAATNLRIEQLGAVIEGFSNNNLVVTEVTQEAEAVELTRDELHDEVEGELIHAS